MLTMGLNMDAINCNINRFLIHMFHFYDQLLTFGIVCDCNCMVNVYCSTPLCSNCFYVCCMGVVWLASMLLTFKLSLHFYILG